MIRLLGLLLLLLVAGPGPAAAQKRVALTFDDVPRAAGAFLTPEQRTARLIAQLRRAGVRQAGFFITTGNLAQPDGAGGARRIQRYVAAGHVIANHSHHHWWASRTPVSDYLADLDRAAAWLAGRPGLRPWYRYPYLDEGRDSPERRDTLRAALAERRLLNAYATIDSFDWHLEALTLAAHADGQPMDRAALRQLYVDAVVGAAEFADSSARDALGRSPAHVMLLHETDLAALFLGDAVRALRARGWQIVTVDEAYQDPIAAAEPETMFLGQGRIAAIAAAAGRPPRALVPQWNEEEHVTALFRQRVLRLPPSR